MTVLVGSCSCQKRHDLEILVDRDLPWTLKEARALQQRDGLEVTLTGDVQYTPYPGTDIGRCGSPVCIILLPWVATVLAVEAVRYGLAQTSYEAVIEDGDEQWVIGYDDDGDFVNGSIESPEGIRFLLRKDLPRLGRRYVYEAARQEAGAPLVEQSLLDRVDVLDIYRTRIREADEEAQGALAAESLLAFSKKAESLSEQTLANGSDQTMASWISAVCPTRRVTSTREARVAYVVRFASKPLGPSSATAALRCLEPYVHEKEAEPHVLYLAQSLCRSRNETSGANRLDEYLSTGIPVDTEACPRVAAQTWFRLRRGQTVTEEMVEAASKDNLFAWVIKALDVHDAVHRGFLLEYAVERGLPGRVDEMLEVAFVPSESEQMFLVEGYLRRCKGFQLGNLLGSDKEAILTLLSRARGLPSTYGAIARLEGIDDPDQDFMADVALALAALRLEEPRSPRPSHEP